MDSGSLKMLMKYFVLVLCCCTLLLSGYGNTDVQTATETGMGAVKALTFSGKDAQFSQLEEKEADDYGLMFFKRERFEPQGAVSALRKIATLSKAHSFLSSHPDPDKRADKLQAQLEGRDCP